VPDGKDMNMATTKLKTANKPIATATRRFNEPELPAKEATVFAYLEPRANGLRSFVLQAPQRKLT